MAWPPIYTYLILRGYRIVFISKDTFYMFNTDKDFLQIVHNWFFNKTMDNWTLEGQVQA